MSDAGTWTTTGPACDRVCPLATLRIGYSERVDAGTGFSDWSPYDFTNVLTAFNSDPQNGGSENQVRVQFEITNPKGLPGVIRYRQLNFFEGNFQPSETIYSAMETQVYNVPPAVGVTTFEFALEPCAIGFGASLIGAPGRANIDIIGLTQAASLNKKGFTRYLPDGLTVHIYKGEAVTSGGDPGCPDAGRPARVYSGHQSYTPGTATAATAWIADPSGVFEDTRSPNLIADKHASTPFGQVNQTVDFGVTTFAGVTVKTSAEQYVCDGTAQAKTLALDLSAPYSTDDLTGAVDAAIDTQSGLGATVAASNGTCFHRKFLASDETFYSRVRTTQIRASALPAGTIAGRAESIDVRVSCVVLARSLTLPATVTKTPKIFTARLYGEGYLTGAFGRGSHQPDASAGEIDVPPEDNPWEDAQFDGKEIRITKIKVKPHTLIVESVPFVELTSVLAEGVDGE